MEHITPHAEEYAAKWRESGGLLIKQKRRNKYTLDFLKSPHAPHTGAAAQSRSGPALCEQQQGGWRGRYGDPGGGGVEGVLILSYLPCCPINI